MATSIEESSYPVCSPERCRLAGYGIDYRGRAVWQFRGGDYGWFDLLIGISRAGLQGMHRIGGDDVAVHGFGHLVGRAGLAYHAAKNGGKQDGQAIDAAGS